MAYTVTEKGGKGWRQKIIIGAVSNVWPSAMSQGQIVPHDKRHDEGQIKEERGRDRVGWWRRGQLVKYILWRGIQWPSAHVKVKSDFVKS